MSQTGKQKTSPMTEKYRIIYRRFNKRLELVLTEREKHVSLQSRWYTRTRCGHHASYCNEFNVVPALREIVLDLLLILLTILEMLPWEKESKKCNWFFRPIISILCQLSCTSLNVSSRESTVIRITVLCL